MRNKRELKKFFRQYSKPIRIYSAITTVLDPYEGNTSNQYLHPKILKAIVNDVEFTKIRWIMPGAVTSNVKQLIIQKKHKKLLELSVKIEIDSEFYEGYKINGRCQYKTEGDYIRVYIYKKEEANA